MPAVGPIPELTIVVQITALFAALGAIAAGRSFRRTGDADRRWEIATNWTTFGLVFGIVAVFIAWITGL